MKISDAKIAFKIGSKFLNMKDISLKPIGHGNNNRVFLVKSKEREIVVKISLSQIEKTYKKYTKYFKA